MTIEPIAVHRQSVKLPSGLSLGLIEWLGAATKTDCPVILFIHGLGDASGVWRDVAAPLAAKFRVLSVDLRGHGDSSWALDGNYKAEAMATDIASLLRLLGLGPVTVAGHSLGGAVALRLPSFQLPEIQSLILADFGLASEPAHMAHILKVLRDAHRSYSSIEDYARSLAERYPLASADLLNWVAKETATRSNSGEIRLKYDPSILTSREQRSVAEANLETTENWALLPKFRCPVLVLRGVASSVLSAKVAERMIRKILYQGTLAEIPAAGHSIHIDNPQAVKRNIETFLEKNYCS
jgi:pimeloyl-ACP methyl ester carboxylesterase